MGEAGNENGMAPFLLGENLERDCLRYCVGLSNAFQQAFLAKLRMCCSAASPASSPSA